MSELVYNLFKQSEYHWDRQDPIKALKYLDDILELMHKEPDYEMYNLALAYKGLCLLSLGIFKQGFELYEFRNNVPATKNPAQRCISELVWQGQDIKGKRLLVVGEQGRGDHIHFARYLPMLEEIGAEVIFQTFPEMVTLFKNSFLVDVQSLKKDPNKIGYDYWIKLMSVPRILEGLPLETVYLSPDYTKVLKWQRHFEYNKFNIGIAWAANPLNGINSNNRSMALSMFEPISRISEDIRLYNLQKWCKEDEVNNSAFNIINLMDKVKNFSDTAAIIGNLDLVISVDTVTAHLAGAMGKPVWTLLPYAGDWRWMWSSDTAIWYESMKLFRQSSPGDWGEVIGRVSTEILNLKKKRLHPVTAHKIPILPQFHQGLVLFAQPHQGTLL